MRANFAEPSSISFGLIMGPIDSFVAAGRAEVPVALWNFPQLLAHRLECTVTERAQRRTLRQIVAWHIVHNLNRKIGLRPRGSADINIHRLLNLAIDLDVLADRPMSAAAWFAQLPGNLTNGWQPAWSCRVVASRARAVLSACILWSRSTRSGSSPCPCNSPGRA